MDADEQRKRDWELYRKEQEKTYREEKRHGEDDSPVTKIQEKIRALYSQLGSSTLVVDVLSRQGIFVREDEVEGLLK